MPPWPATRVFFEGGELLRSTGPCKRQLGQGGLAPNRQGAGVLSSTKLCPDAPRKILSDYHPTSDQWRVAGQSAAPPAHACAVARLFIRWFLLSNHIFPGSLTRCRRRHLLHSAPLPETGARHTHPRRLRTGCTLFVESKWDVGVGIA